MNNNLQYRGWFRRNFEGLRQKVRQIELDFQAECDRRITARQRELNPKSSRKVLPDLPDDEQTAILEPLRAEWLVWAGPIHDTLERARKLRGERLDSLAADVQVAPADCMYRVKRASTSSYSTQTQPFFYAEQELTPYRAALQKLGLETHVRYREEWRSSGAYPYSYGTNSGGSYELWANVPPWMADAVFRRITIEDALRALPRTVNAKVLMPFLDYERFERHMMGGYG